MSATYNIKFRIPSIDVATFELTLKEQLQVMVRKAAREWIRAAIVTVPTYSATARGTFKPLGRFLRVAIPVGKVVSRRTSHKVRGQVYQLGFDQGANYSDYKFVIEGNRISFKFDQDLPWAVWNAFGHPVPQVKSAP